LAWVHLTGFKDEAAACRHGILGVDSQVHDHLLELTPVPHYVGEIRIQLHHDLNILADGPAEQFLETLQQ
jgi:hypothetical protein